MIKIYNTQLITSNKFNNEFKFIYAKNYTNFVHLNMFLS